ncbi:hypothetical protein [Bacillus dakarensis]|uniref:hypothetical protein n=1 Tax=Robertmurraya dakarensis TaxID=1926278 RepID=UPI000981D611|nr:hypothetical protein [Bacillus dakarensis]
MEKIYSQPYSIIERKIIDNEQHIIKRKSFIRLYQDKITTDKNVFLMREIHDISYRQGLLNGMLYIHTNQGVFPYMVLSDPARFIEEVKKLIV